jgi:hypothetical protein
MVFSVNSGRESDSRTKTGWWICGNTGQSQRGNHNPSLRGSHIAEKVNEVGNPKEVMLISRENNCVFGS